MPIRTVFDMAEDCVHGERQGWAEFARDYEPMARTLLAQYFPTSTPDLDNAVRAMFVRAHEGGNAWFRGIQFANEREFAFHFRELVVEYGRRTFGSPGPDAGIEEVTAMLDGLALIQRQFFWAFLRGYNVEQASAILMNASATAQDMSHVTQERLTRAFPAAERSAIAQAAMTVAHGTGTADCASLKTFNNLINGQIAWHDRERTEQHIGQCLNCLDRFTAFQEVIWLRRATGTAPEDKVTRVLQILHLRNEPKGFLKKLFSRAG